MAAVGIPYDATEARQQVRSLLNEPTASFWSDEEINNWVLEAIIDISSKTLCVKKVDTIALVEDTLTYTAMVSGGAGSVALILRVYAALYGKSDGSTDYKGLECVKPWQLQHLPNKVAGPPSYYFHFNTVFGVYPLPTLTEQTASCVIQVYYSGVSETIGDIPSYYHPFIVKFAAAMALFKAKQWQAGNLLYSDYMNMIQYHRADLHDPPATSREDLKQPDRTVAVG